MFFFPVCDILLRFISFNQNFSAPIELIQQVVPKTLQMVHNLTLLKRSADENFFSAIY